MVNIGNRNIISNNCLYSQIHSKGLKFGLYQSMGLKTCAGYPGIWGHIEDDAKTYAEWGIDLVKMDSCYNLGKKLFGEGIVYSTMSKLCILLLVVHAAPIVVIAPSCVG